MKTYVVGDLQGCREQTDTLLERIHQAEAVPPAILFAGDLINRGPDSLGALRRVRELNLASGGRIDSVLGNHDLHLLAVAYGIRPEHKSDTLKEILDAPDRGELVDWLRQRPLALMAHGHLIVHAGLLPQWSAARALELAGEVAAMLRGPDVEGFLRQMYGNEPAQWRDELQGAERLRCIINAMTRLRFCDAYGVMDFKMKESGTVDPATGLMPWFDVPGRASAADQVVFGHWSALGLMVRDDVICLDSGCVWGGQLTAVCLDDRQLLQVPCPAFQRHSGIAA
jgi:bis(5'-nucleosyl)-tetraphosphatase (symmetrical)